MPLVVYGDGQPTVPYVPSGYMGATDDISMDEECPEKPRSGTTCLKVRFAATSGWGGVVWQSPENDWGDLPGGYDLTGAGEVEFWARGAKGGEVVSFSLGLLGADKPYPDSCKAELKDATLTSEWNRYTMPLAGEDLSRVKTGFAWVVASKGAPTVFYLDDIRYVASK